MLYFVLKKTPAPSLSPVLSLSLSLCPLRSQPLSLSLSLSLSLFHPRSKPATRTASTISRPPAPSTASTHAAPLLSRLHQIRIIHHQPRLLHPRDPLPLTPSTASTLPRPRPSPQLRQPFQAPPNRRPQSTPRPHLVTSHTSAHTRSRRPSPPSRDHLHQRAPAHRCRPQRLLPPLLHPPPQPISNRPHRLLHLRPAASGATISRPRHDPCLTAVDSILQPFPHLKSAPTSQPPPHLLTAAATPTRSRLLSRSSLPPATAPLLRSASASSAPRPRRSRPASAMTTSASSIL